MPEPLNARQREIAPGIIAERLATAIHLFWTPADDSCQIAFQTSEHLFVNGQWQPFAGGAGEVLSVQLADILDRTFGEGLTDPVTGASLDGVSSGGVMLIIKRAFDVLWSERSINSTPTAP
ncbi:MAG: hypothetical protein KatS3mg128_0091 [Silanimonas sp.]|nr:MAG: hypothetical protein KatS3mg128_0091 [Silanimonas sp.]